jgi:hypothetical protein
MLQVFFHFPNGKYKLPSVDQVSCKLKPFFKKKYSAIFAVYTNLEDLSTNHPHISVDYP